MENTLYTSLYYLSAKLAVVFLTKEAFIDLFPSYAHFTFFLFEEDLDIFQELYLQVCLCFLYKVWLRNRDVFLYMVEISYEKRIWKKRLKSFNRLTAFGLYAPYINHKIVIWIYWIIYYTILIWITWKPIKKYLKFFWQFLKKLAISNIKQ